jgi:hypothetical protein
MNNSSYIITCAGKKPYYLTQNLIISMIRAKNGFPKLSFAEFSKKLNEITSSMNGNQNFTSLQAQVNTLITEGEAYQALATKAASRDKDAIIARDASREKVTDLLHTISYGVTAIANNNVAILSSSGFSYMQPSKPTAPMTKPAVPKLRSGVNSGEITCKTSAQAGMKSVNYYITTDAAALTDAGTNTWDVTTYNATKYTFTALTPGQRYYIRVGLVGVRGQEVLSDAIPYIAQ